MKKILFCILFFTGENTFCSNEATAELTTLEQTRLNKALLELLNKVDFDAQDEEAVIALLRQGANPKKTRLFSLEGDFFFSMAQSGFSKIIQYLKDENLFPHNKEVKNTLEGLSLTKMMRRDAFSSSHLEVEKILQDHLNPIPPK